jgi:hypothetical protein
MIWMAPELGETPGHNCIEEGPAQDLKNGTCG